MSQRPRQGPSDLSKNPAAGGRVRSSSSPHSPVVGTKYLHFTQAIFSKIKKEAEKDGIELNLHEVQEFARAYPDANPPINPPRGMIFGPDHVAAAFERFKEQYQPPQPAPQPAPQSAQQPRNPNNLFGQLRTLGRRLGIPDETLIDYLKWLTSLPRNREIAENPSAEDVEHGYHQMLQDISPGAEMFRNVVEHGLSPETLGSTNFRKLTEMKNGPQHGCIWEIQRCPHPRKLIQKLSFKEGVAGVRNLSCFVSGFFIEPNGELVHFNCPDKRKKNSVGWARDDMVGKPVIFWTSEVGQVIYTKTQGQFDCGQHDYTLGVGRRGADYSGGDISYDHQGKVCTWGKLKGDALDEEMKEDRHAFFAREHVTAPEKENLHVGKNHSLDREIRSDPEYQAACKEAMAQIGGIPVSLCSTLGHEEAVKAEGPDHCGAAATDGWGAAAP